MRNSGKLLKLPDGRICIMYDKQPLRESKGKIILHLVDDNHNRLMGEDGRPKTLLKPTIWLGTGDGVSFIGFVD